MREIKFRAWSKPENKMYYIDGIENCISFEGENGKEWHQYSRIEGFAFSDTDSLNADLMQFIGLYDKNNNPTYDDDIILIKDGQMISQSYDFQNDDQREEFGDIVSQIKFISPSFCYFHPNVDEWVPIDCEFEIIGNIHQNKDLLK